MIARELPAAPLGQLVAYADVFLRWNAKMNLSAARTMDALDEHIADCVFAAAQVPTSGRLLDVGSGGGLPGLVIAVCHPALQVTMLEPVNKKTSFLRAAGRELKLGNIDAHAERLEVHPICDYDAAISRATMDLADWLAAAITYVRPGGEAFGMEAVPRDDLPALAARQTYEVAGKRRAIVRLLRSS